MDTLEGVMLIPPDRTQILGRALWKARYVVAGRKRTHRDARGSQSQSQLLQNNRVLSRVPIEEPSLSIYKTKPPLDMDWEPSHQWPLSSITKCEVQTVAHRKQGPALPTLIITISDLQRKRRSSRAAGFLPTSSKDPAETVLWFRSPNDEPHVSLHEWARFITSRKISPLSPDSPVSPLLSNPFASNPFSPKPREPRDESEYPPRPSSSHMNYGRSLHHKCSTATYSTGPRERPLTFSSESPSLRSKRSDVSSPSSQNYTVQQMTFPMPGQHFAPPVPSDMPSPLASAAPRDYQGEFIEGWTSAQGRSPTVSSPTRASVGSHAQRPSITESSSPPAPRETILDRAFQLRCIPGSEMDTPGEEKLSSLARFEALMQEVDEKRKVRETADEAQQAVVRVGAHVDDSTDDSEEDSDSDIESDHSEDFAQDSTAHDNEPSLIPSVTQRALKFIASRDNLQEQPQRRTMVRNPVSYHGGSMTGLSQAPSHRPHTAHGKTRSRQNTNRTEDVPMSPELPSPTQLDPLMLPGIAHTSEEGIIRPHLEHRQSSPSGQRLSFTEFTKRLSSTSSLLLVQTNASSGSNRSGADLETTALQPSASSAQPRTAQGLRASVGSSPKNNWDEQDQRCRWRGSVGVIGTEGGFL